MKSITKIVRRMETLSPSTKRNLLQWMSNKHTMNNTNLQIILSIYIINRTEQISFLNQITKSFPRYLKKKQDKYLDKEHWIWTTKESTPLYILFMYEGNENNVNKSDLSWFHGSSAIYHYIYDYVKGPRMVTFESSWPTNKSDEN